ncbi:MAG: OB-fold nucleic acid binding domain-containing protein [Thermoprotei archaeon]
MEIKELTRSGIKNVNIEAVIVSISEPRTVTLRNGQQSRVADAVLQDDSGDQISLSLWDSQIDRFSEGDRVKIENGYTTEFRGKIQVNVGKYGNIVKVE